MSTAKMNVPQLDAVESALAKLIARLRPVLAETVTLQNALGRVLADVVMADRDSPAHDVSAMDGYAIRLDDFKASNTPPIFPVSGIAYAGSPPIDLASGTAVQIFTGGCVPFQANCVVRREDTREHPQQVELQLAMDQLRVGQNIRQQGENIKLGEVVLPTGTEIDSASIGSLATFASATVSVRRKIRVSLLQSGDELIEAGQPVQPWQIRDSNGPTLRSWLLKMHFVELIEQSKVRDHLSAVKQALTAATTQSNLTIVTGGVSAGDTDFIPKAIVELGGEIIFHRLPIRPGKPILAALLGGNVVVGLPGNPVSTAVTARVFAQQVLDSLTGRLPRRQIKLQIENPDANTLPLHQYRLAQLNGPSVRLLDTRGSGDLVSMVQSDGFVEIPAGCSGAGPWKFWFW